jgi:hypothetical protein
LAPEVVCRIGSLSQYSIQILSYTRGTKALIRNATASDFHEASVSNADFKADKKLTAKEQQEKKVEIF